MKVTVCDYCRAEGTKRYDLIVGDAPDPVDSRTGLLHEYVDLCHDCAHEHIFKQVWHDLDIVGTLGREKYYTTNGSIVKRVRRQK